jgi:hypothetical protein
MQIYYYSLIHLVIDNLLYNNPTYTQKEPRNCKFYDSPLDKFIDKL